MSTAARGLRVCLPNSLFMRSRLLGNTNSVKRVATQQQLAVYYSPGPCCKPRKLDRYNLPYEARRCAQSSDVLPCKTSRTYIVVI